MLTTVEDSATLPSLTASTPAGSLAEVNAVPPKEAGRVLSALNIWIATGLTLAPIPAALVTGIGGLVLAASLYGKNPTAAGACAIAALACGAACVFVLVSFQQFLASRYLRWTARQAFAGRVEPLVRPDDADAEFLDVIPRGNWGMAMLEPASDVGFFTIDQSRCELRFEGDGKRYLIPFAAVTECQVEEYAMGSEKWAADLHYITVLGFETANGPRELPLAGRHLEFCRRRAAERRAQACDLCSRILVALNR